MRWWRRAALVAACLVAGLVPGATRAQDYPNRPVTLVAPTAPGGVIDRICRILAAKFSEAWKSQVVVEHRPGANNQLAAEYIVNSAPDGHTLFIAPDGTFVANPSLYPKLPYDPHTSFTPIVGLVIINHGLMFHPAFPPNNIKELIERARQKPGEINYGTFGIGSSGHLNIVLIEGMTGAKFTPVHYRGAAPGITDLIGGHIQMMIVSIGLIAPGWQAGKLKVLGFGSTSRIAKFPDVPTLAESGLPGYEAGSWYGLAAPKGTPRDVVGKLNAETQRIFNDPAFQEKFLTPSFIFPITSSPEDFAARIRTESAKWGKVIKEAGIRVE